MHFTRVENNLQREKCWRVMIESTLQGLALLALASIAINLIKWLLRRPVALLLTVVMLGVTAWLQS